MLEKPEQAISEVKLSGITTLFKAVGMKAVLRLGCTWRGCGWDGGEEGEGE